MGHGLDRKPSQAWATKMLTLTTPNTTETISIITTILALGGLDTASRAER
jgi:hypothetical protein